MVVYYAVVGYMRVTLVACADVLHCFEAIHNCWKLGCQSPSPVPMVVAPVGIDERWTTGRRDRDSYRESQQHGV